ncbi:TetR/AcrR family transcriptional regulator, partial [Sphingopyxis flava]
RPPIQSESYESQQILREKPKMSPRQNSSTRPRTAGFRSTTVEQIAELAGTTVPTFYRHFKSKDDLFGPLRDHLCTEVDQVTMKLDDIDVRDLAAVRGWLDTYMVMWTRVHRLCEAYWEAAHSNDDHAREVFPIAMGGVKVMQKILARVDPDAREKMEMHLVFIFLSIDRIISAVAVEDNSSQANKIMDYLAHFIWSILNNYAPIQNTDKFYK